MKRMCTLILMLAIVASVKAVEPIEGNQYRICGDIKGLKGWVYLGLLKGSINSTIDSTLVRDGKFTFEGSIEQLDFARVSGEGRFFVPLVPDSPDIVITGSMEKPKDMKLTGSPMTEKVIGLRSYFSGKLNKAYNSSIEKRDSALMDFKKELSRVVSENSDNLAGAFVIVENANHLSAEEKIYNISLLSPRMQENSPIKKLALIANAQQAVSNGRRYVDIKTVDTLGRNISLSEVVGKSKYVLIDFWASWCGPCIASLPALKKLYDKYHSKGFDIFGISIDTKRNLWTEAIVKHGIGWHNGSNLLERDCPAAQSYGVYSVPDTFLIGSDGVILKKDIRIDELEQILQDNL